MSRRKKRKKRRRAEHKNNPPHSKNKLRAKVSNTGDTTPTAGASTQALAFAESQDVGKKVGGALTDDEHKHLLCLNWLEGKVSWRVKCGWYWGAFSSGVIQAVIPDLTETSTKQALVVSIDVFSSLLLAIFPITIRKLIGHFTTFDLGHVSYWWYATLAVTSLQIIKRWSKRKTISLHLEAGHQEKQDRLQYRLASCFGMLAKYVSIPAADDRKVEENELVKTINDCIKDQCLLLPLQARNWQVNIVVPITEDGSSMRAIARTEVDGMFEQFPEEFTSKFTLARYSALMSTYSDTIPSGRLLLGDVCQKGQPFDFPQPKAGRKPVFRSKFVSPILHIDSTNGAEAAADSMEGESCVGFVCISSSRPYHFNKKYARDLEVSIEPFVQFLRLMLSRRKCRMKIGTSNE